MQASINTSSKHLKQHCPSRCCRVFMSYHTPQNLTWGGALLPHPGGNRHVMAWPRNGFWKNTNFYGIDLSAAVQRCAKPLGQSWVQIIFRSLCLPQEDPKLQNFGSAKAGDKDSVCSPQKHKPDSSRLFIYFFLICPECQGALPTAHCGLHQSGVLGVQSHRNEVRGSDCCAT